VKLEAHGISVELPVGWEGRIYKRPEGDPTLHAANFALPHRDGDFGSRATAHMRPGDMFVTITEYRPGGGLEPGRGLFAARPPRLPLDPRRFHRNTLLVARPGQAGLQHFYTQSGRPFCLYAVLCLPRRGFAARVGPRVETLSGVLSGVEIAPRER
jgi:hypothetical protein